MEDSAAAIIYHGMTFHVVVLCCVTLFLLLVSALVSGSETAFFSLSGNDVRKIRRHDTPVCRRMLNLLGKADLLLATILVVNNLVNIGIVILSSEIIDSLFTFARFEFLFKTVIVTFLLLLFGEILPKVAAQTIPLRFAGFAARPLLVLRWIFYPLSYVLVRTGNRISERAAHHQEISIGELADAIDMTRTASKEEHGMLSGIVSFVNTEVQEIMKPRVDITAVAITDSYEQVKQTIIRSGFSRIPVYEGDLDNIKGTLYVKDLLSHIDRGDEFGWQQLIRRPYFVPEHKKINDLLADFQNQKIHMAIVVDEFGGTEGLVTMEDIIEEIVGEIRDEYDDEERTYAVLNDHTWVFEAKTQLTDFYKITKIDEETFDEVAGDADTLAGLLLELKGEFPVLHEKVVYDCYEFEVLEMDNRRILKVKFTVNEPAGEGSETEK